MEDLTNKIMNQMVNSLDLIFIKGLENKGYTFESKAALIDFVIKNVSAAVFENRTTYYVNSVPFLVIEKQELKIEHNFHTDFSTKINTNLGYDFL